MKKLCRRFAVAKVICSSHYWTASLKYYFSTRFSHASLKYYFCTRFSHVSIIESRVGSCENVLANRIETSYITSPLNSIWIGGWFSLPMCIPFHGNFLLPGNPFYKWMKIEMTNLKLFELWKGSLTANMYMSKVCKWNTRTRYNICSKLTLETPDVDLVPFLSTLNMFYILF